MMMGFQFPLWNRLHNELQELPNRLSQMQVRFGVAVEGDLGRAATISVDDVNVVRRN